MRNISLFILFSAFSILGMGFGCHNNNENDEVPAVEITFELLNRDLEPRTAFETGEDVLFKLEIKNLSNNGTLLLKFHPDDEQLFRLKKWARLSDSSSQEGWLDMGSPINEIGQYIYMLGYPILAKSSFTIIISPVGNHESTELPDGWQVDYDSNIHLDKGKYAVEFTFQATFMNSTQTPEKFFRKEFNIN